MKKIEFADVEQLIRMALDEDLGQGDITSRAIFSVDERSSAIIIAKQNGIFCGSDIIGYVYRMISSDIDVKRVLPDGTAVAYGEEVANITGPTIALLEGERVVLNFIQRMSGISTRTKEMVKLLEGSGITLLDTRKTLPGFRMLDKHAVAVGGGTNHRMGLYDMVMIKDNHIEAAGGIMQAVERIRSCYGNRFLVEVEASTLDEVRQAVESGADIIMLDNMDNSLMEQSAGIIGKKAKIEVSGNMDEGRICAIKTLPVDYVSAGTLTHTVRAFDLSMKFRREPGY